LLLLRARRSIFFLKKTAANEVEKAEMDADSAAAKARAALLAAAPAGRRASNPAAIMSWNDAKVFSTPCSAGRAERREYRQHRQRYVPLKATDSAVCHSRHATAPHSSSHAERDIFCF